MKMNGTGISEASGESAVCKSFVVAGTCSSSISIFLSESDFAFSLNACSKISSSDIFFSAWMKIAVPVSADLEDDMIFFIKDFRKLFW